jgi:hypothetical protein
MPAAEQPLPTPLPSPAGHAPASTATRQCHQNLGNSTMMVAQKVKTLSIRHCHFNKIYGPLASESHFLEFRQQFHSAPESDLITQKNDTALRSSRQMQLPH